MLYLVRKTVTDIKDQEREGNILCEGFQGMISAWFAIFKFKLTGWQVFVDK